MPAAGSTTYAVGSAATSVIRQLFDAKPEVTKFAGMGSVDRLYNRRTAVPEEKAGGFEACPLAKSISNASYKT